MRLKAKSRVGLRVLITQGGYAFHTVTKREPCAIMAQNSEVLARDGQADPLDNVKPWYCEPWFQAKFRQIGSIQKPGPLFRSGILLLAAAFSQKGTGPANGVRSRDDLDRVPGLGTQSRYDVGHILGVVWTVTKAFESLYADKVMASKY